VFQIIEKPRQFVSTEQFFGPDRRRKKGKDYSGPRRRENDALKDAPPIAPEAVDILRKLSEETKKI
jgi:hypothetical protein